MVKKFTDLIVMIKSICLSFSSYSSYNVNKIRVILPKKHPNNSELNKFVLIKTLKGGCIEFSQSALTGKIDNKLFRQLACTNIWEKSLIEKLYFKDQFC